MSVEGEHGRIIAAAANAALTPLGFRRKGRSRLWLADRGFWLSVVEFQPSGFSKGSYLNVATHWLWGLHDFMSFDHMVDDRRTFIQFTDAAAFAPLATQQAQDAAEASEALRIQFSTLKAAALILTEQERSWEREGRGGGSYAFDAAILEGLAGDVAVAQAFFQSALRSFAAEPDYIKSIQELEGAVGVRDTFRAMVELRINHRRESLDLPRLPAGFLENF
jgi:hypothetical protein